MKVTLARLTMLVLAAAAVGAAHAADRDEFNKRAATADVALFDALDRNQDGMLTRDEAHGDLNLGPRFDDMDINRDGTVTRAELERYIGQRYGVTLSASK